MSSKKIYITGMHCVSCEKILDSEFREISGVIDVKVDRKKNFAEIFYAENEPSFASIKQIAQKFNYDAFEKEPILKKKTKWADWINAIFIVVVILFVFKIFQDLGIADKINPKNTGLNYGMAFLVGLVASVSSCLAVVGSVVIAFAEKYQTENKSFWGSTLKPNALFHLGRLTTFFVLGGILGMVGGGINISGNFIAIYTIIIALVMALLGLNILGWVPSITTFGIKMPSGLSRSWEKLKKSEHRAAPLLIGGLSFFLPCGFTQSMQIFALASGSFLTGASSLFLFALGTMPILLAVGVSTAWTKNSKTVVFQKVAGFLILIFAIYTISNGLALRGSTANIFSTVDKNVSEEKKSISEENKNSEKMDEQIAKMSILASGFQPNVLKIKSGVPVKFVINGDQATGCTSVIIIPSFNISKNIKAGENIITFTPTQKGEIPFSCGMGMVRGKFIVE